MSKFDITKPELAAIRLSRVELIQTAGVLRASAETEGAGGADVSSILALAAKFERTAEGLSRYLP